MKRIFLVFILFSCHPDKNTPIDLEKIKYKTTDQSEIFFKNIRRSYYQIEELPDAGIEIYRFKKVLESNTPPFYPMIVYNWRNDFASLLIENLENNEPGQYSILFESGNNKTGEITFEPANHQIQTQIAIEIYNALLNHEQIYLVKGQEKEFFFANNDESENFRITVFDFLRLVQMR